jgi:hypothetical protein
MSNPESSSFSPETAYLSNREINRRIDLNFPQFPIDLQVDIAQRVIQKMDSSRNKY